MFLANRWLSETFAVMHALGMEGAYVNGQKYHTTNRDGVVVYDGLTPYRENHLTEDVSNTNSKPICKGTAASTAPYCGVVVLAGLILTNVSHGIFVRCALMPHR